MISAFNFIQNNLNLNSFSRIFKINGRYLLADDFDIRMYEHQILKDKYTFALHNFGWLCTMMYSLDSSLFLEYKNLLPKLYDGILNETIGYYESIKSTALESSLYELLDKNKIILLSQLNILALENSPNRYMQYAKF